MSNPNSGSVTRHLDPARLGDDEAVRALWEKFFPRLVGLARGAMTGQAQRAADAEDAALSAFAAFCRQFRDDGFPDVLDRDSLWKLLGTITVRKARRLSRHENAAKRKGTEDLVGDGDAAVNGAAPESDLICQELLDSLGEELKPYAALRLLGYQNKEIAQAFDCTERKVERKLNLIRQKWENTLSE